MNSLITPSPVTRPATLAAAPAAIRREVENGIVTLTFDRPQSSANIFDENTLNELDAHLSWIETKEGLLGLILTSAKPSIFVAGADLKSLSLADEKKLSQIVTLGQTVFDRLSRLPMPKVAAIHGACVGGGFEVALACDWRVATNEKATQIGLPEVQLGILPAWGGSTRLPRLIGLPKALRVILDARPMTAKKALKLGLIDAISPLQYLPAAARKLLGRGGRKFPSHFLTNNRLSAALIRRKVRKDILSKTQGLYPAPLAALDTAVDGLRRRVRESLDLERKAFLNLVSTPAARNLIRAFFQTERVKKFGSSVVVSAPPITRAAVIGAGVMGAGIAQWLASRGISVQLHDIAPERVAAGLRSARDQFAEAVKRGIMDRNEAMRAMDRITPVANGGPLTSVEIVIEAATEDMALKKKIFRSLAERTRADTILATNTSALGVEAIAGGIPHAERVVGLHFFNPVSRMKLVEVATWPDASQDAVNRTIQFAAQIGKLPILVHDSPGFVVNRVLMPYLLEAGRLFDHGASPEEIDRAMLEFGMPMGPLRLLDEVGLDVSLHVANTLCEAMPGRLSTPPVLTHLVEAGNLGRKSKRGFYTYKADGSVLAADAAALESRLTREPMHIDRGAIRDRLVMLMVNEAAYCLHEGVVQKPEDVDFAMLMGVGFAPLHGGPLRYADAVGIGAMVRKLEGAAHATGDDLFAPCPLLIEKMINDATFYSG